MTFWEHLDELRGSLVKAVVAVLVCAVAAFCFKDALFSIVFAPKEPGFCTYRFFGWVAGEDTSFRVDLINVELAQQFMVHMKVAFYAGLLVVSPYLIYLLFAFVAPALYEVERRYALRAVTCGFLMFWLGLLFTYFVLFPLTFRFLGTYQVSESVSNMISLDSYISTLVALCLVMGLMFEIPILGWVLAKIGVISSAMMVKVRRHAIVAVLVLAAVITPTGDMFTLMLVAMPLYLLYELTILCVKHTEKTKITIEKQ